MTSKLILLRHGESEWNAKNLFTGWVDVDVNEKGAGEAKRAGELLKQEGLLPDKLHTSLLRRAIHTAYTALDVADRHWIPVERSWRLNERHYGALSGLNKAETAAKFGDDQVQLGIGLAGKSSLLFFLAFAVDLGFLKIICPGVAPLFGVDMVEWVC